MLSTRFGGLFRQPVCHQCLQLTFCDMSAIAKCKLDGKVAVVTASTEGIGFAIAKRLGQDGAAVVVSSRKEVKVEKAVELLQKEGIDVAGFTCHVGKAEDRSKLLRMAAERYGGIDILVSNAGTNPVFGPILDTSEDAWDKMFDTNVKAGFMFTKEVVPYMEKRKGGSIVLVSSITGYVAMPLLGVYSVTKTALLGLTKALAPQLAASNIRINSVAPGIVKTAFSKALWTLPGASEKILEMTPLGRLAEPDECSGTVSFLCSNDSSYITGETIVIAGGMTSHL